MRDLGKWPRLAVAGDPVSEQQADIILIRTMDYHLPHCNDKEWLAQVRAIAAEAGMPFSPDRNDFASHDTYLHATWHQWMPAFDKLAERHGFLPYLGLDQVGNDRILCTSTGWCSWTGTIGCVRNIGKWPSHEGVLEKWQQIAKAFPFLRLSAELTPEGGTHEDAVRYEVADGAVTMAPSGHLPELEPPAEWVQEMSLRTPLDERGVDAARLRTAFRNALS